MLAERSSVAGSMLLSMALAAIAIMWLLARPAAPIDRAAELDAERNAILARAQAETEAALARFRADLAQMDARIEAALRADHGCELGRKRSLAVRRLENLKREQGLLRERRARIRGIKISAACVENPLARDCM